jgi:hypothetical protein
MSRARMTLGVRLEHLAGDEVPTPEVLDIWSDDIENAEGLLAVVDLPTVEGDRVRAQYRIEVETYNWDSTS